jgi:hypothetical protein
MLLPLAIGLALKARYGDLATSKRPWAELAALKATWNKAKRSALPSPRTLAS